MLNLGPGPGKARKVATNHRLTVPTGSLAALGAEVGGHLVAMVPPQGGHLLLLGPYALADVANLATVAPHVRRLVAGLPPGVGVTAAAALGRLAAKLDEAELRVEQASPRSWSSALCR